VDGGLPVLLAVNQRQRVRRQLARAAVEHDFPLAQAHHARGEHLGKCHVVDVYDGGKPPLRADFTDEPHDLA
jgi:hypothetical protein